ncbi:MAG: N-acetylmuramoyl-L-alanine amidase [Sulfurimonas sp.]|nr:N-acetylmuramoyl-L-alanine amidase [Sulfurimonas sp.]
MFRLLLLSFVFTLALSALSDKEIVKRANGFMQSSNKSNHFRAYNDYKNLYLRSIMSENESLKVTSLRGIVKSGNKLHIDVSQYSNELSTLKPKSVYTKPIRKPTLVKKNTSKKLKIKSSHKLKSIRFINDELVLEFDKKLSTKQINYFTLYDPKKKQYRYVFDIHASMLTSSQTIRKKGIKRIKLAQYTPSTLRLVIEDTKKLKVNYSKRGNLLALRVGDSPRYKKAKAITKTRPPVRLDRNKVLVIDAGHGGKDPGAVGYRKYREKVIVLSIAKKLKTILNSRGYKVYMTRDRDKFVKLSNRTKYANKKNADIFISIHANSVPKRNAHKAYGVECYFLSPSRSGRAKKVAAKENSADLSDMNFYGKQSFLNTLNNHNIIASNKLAIDLQRGMLGSLKKTYKNVKDGGVREGPFWVLVGAQMPSVLVEVGFVSNPKEAKRLVNSSYQKKLAYGLANGVERYFKNSQ